MGLKRTNVVENMEKETSETVEAQTVEPKAQVESVAVEEFATKAEKHAEQEVAVVQKTEIAPAPQQTGIRTVDPLQGSGMEGFEGFELDHTSQPNIVLNKGVFRSDVNGEEFKEYGFTFRMLGTRKKFLFETMEADPDERDVLYSYNSRISEFSDEEKLRVEEFEREDRTLSPTPKQYLEISALLEDTEFVGTEVTLQIPKCSIGRISGLVARQRRKLGMNSTPADYTVKASIGPEVGKGQKAFNPWAFDVAGE